MKKYIILGALLLSQVVPASTGTFVESAKPEDAFVKWAIQSGSFAAVFAPLTIVMFRWLASRLEVSQAAQGATKDDMIKVLTETVKISVETNKHVTVMLEQVGKLCDKTVQMVDNVEKRLERENNVARHAQD